MAALDILFETGQNAALRPGASLTLPIQSFPFPLKPPEFQHGNQNNAAFDSDLIYWTKGVDEGELKRMLEGSLCFGLYALPGSSAEIAGVSFSQCKIGIVSRAEYKQAETTQSKSV
jgi:hypothetical protein